MIGKRVAHYKIEEQIGAGGMGVVYRAHDEELERSVALKVLPSGLLAEESARRRFRKEALALAKLNHPNIATVHEFGNEQDLDFLVTEYIAGETLDQKLANGALAEKEVVRLGSQLAQGLEAAHAEGIVHRDLKPGNLRITPDGFWTGAVAAETRRGGSCGNAHANADAGWNAAVHGAGTVAGRGDRRKERHLVGGSGAVRNGDGTARIPRDQRATADQRDPEP
jgi:serine/threonine protein kinase